MIRWQLGLFWPLVVAMLGLVAFTLYVFSHSERLYRLKLALIPALLGVAAFSFPWFGTRLGYAYPEGLPASFEYVAHRTIVQDRRKAWIDILVVSRKPLESDTRLHRVPWSRPLEEALKQAQRMQPGGGWIEMDRAQREGDDPHWMPRRVLPQDVLPKDALPDREPDLLRPKGPMA